MRPIKMNEQLAHVMAVDMIQQMMSQGEKAFQSGTFTYIKNFTAVAKEKIVVNFTPEAYEQMFALINHFDCEVAWEGCVERLDQTHFRINKIVLYPQEVTSATVNTDDGEYATWRMTLPDEIFNHLFFQGHSHVNMATNPSGTDIADQWRTIGNLQPNDFQIFMIWNKRHEFYVRVVDMATNTIYDPADCVVTVGTVDTSSFLAEADKLVKKKAPKYPPYSAYTGYTGGNYNGAPSYPGAASASAKVGTASTAKPAPKAASLKTVTGSAAPKVNGKGSNLNRYYRANPDELVANGNSSCMPYYDQFDD